MAKLTPMMKQYLEIKAQHKDSILMFRLGDFYEMFADDAVIASRELDLVLTTRDKSDNEDKMPMCGVPHHSVDAYIAKLIQRGYKVALCDQMEDPREAKGIVKREVTKTLTPGTVVDGDMLDEKSNNFLAVIFKSGADAGLAFADVSTGEMYVTEINDDKKNEKIKNEVSKYAPREIIINESADDKALKAYFADSFGARYETYFDSSIDTQRATRIVTEQFAVDNVKKLNLPSEGVTLYAVSAMIEYLERNNKQALGYMLGLEFYNDSQYMNLDASSRRNLELAETMRRQDKKGSLYWVLDKTKTSMGARLLKSWIEKPLINVAAITNRLNSVEGLYKNMAGREEIREILADIHDVSRIMAKVVSGTVNCKELVVMRSSISRLPQLKDALLPFTMPMLNECNRNIDSLEDIYSLLEKALPEEAPSVMSKVDIIADGYDEEIDKYRVALKDGKGWLTDFETREREKTGIKNLKVSFNKVFGYYIDISKGNLDKVPEYYDRKQTLVNNERFISPELKEFETVILSAQEKIEEREAKVFNDVRMTVAAAVERVKRTMEAIACLDVLASLAHVAVKNQYVMPSVDISDVIEIKDGRHPVVERVLRDEMFVPNDVYLDTKDNEFVIITGPNMAGKSTYMRQVALITLMAQIGSFVPASSCRVGVVDRIFTRVGASDDLAMGQSTFMVEMSELANILKNATKNSLIILDEIGRGTSTYDGLSIAWSVVEYISNKKNIGARTLFATHYHELTELENRIEGVKNYCIVAKKHGDEVVFLRKIARGGADESYGIEVAALAGAPKALVKRAKEILADIEKNGRAGDALPESMRSTKGIERENGQIMAGDFKRDEIIDKLDKLELSVLSPIEALNKLYEIQKEIKEIL